MKHSRLFFGTPTSDFAKAFPTVKSLTGNVEQDIYGFYLKEGDWRKNSRLSGKSVTPEISCCNPACYRGGLDVQQILRMMTLSRQSVSSKTVSCPGDEGSPAGRRKGQTCDNAFRYEISIEYIDEP